MKSTRYEHNVEKAVGLSRAQILTLIKAAGAERRGTPLSGGGMAAQALERKGMLRALDLPYLRELTDAGRAAFTRARALGY